MNEVIPIEGGWSVVEDLKEVFIYFFSIMDYDFVAGGVRFSLLDVFFAGGILSLVGSVIGLVFLFTQKRR